MIYCAVCGWQVGEACPEHGGPVFSEATVRHFGRRVWECQQVAEVEGVDDVELLMGESVIVIAVLGGIAKAAAALDDEEETGSLPLARHAAMSPPLR